jgi:histidine triad (HIT) family protein
MLKLLLSAARWRIFAVFAGKLFVMFIDQLPLNRIYDGPFLVAFYHPQPVYSIHILMVPKQDLSSIDALDEIHTGLLFEIFKAARQIALKLGLVESGYRLIVNNGNYQEFPQFQIHFVAGQSVCNKGGRF